MNFKFPIKLLLLNEAVRVADSIVFQILPGKMIKFFFAFAESEAKTQSSESEFLIRDTDGAEKHQPFRTRKIESPPHEKRVLHFDILSSRGAS